MENSNLHTNLVGRRAQIKEPCEGQTVYLRAGQWGEIVACWLDIATTELILTLAMDDESRGELYAVPARACRLEGVPGGATNQTKE